MPTIRDVAKKAGVSVATVSRVINNSSRVSESTKRKVLNAMNELGYTPRPWAKYLALPKTKVKVNAIITPRIKKYMKKNAFYYEVAKGIKKVATSSGVDVDFVMKGSKDELKCDGLLLIGADFKYDDVKNYIEECQRPVVLVDNYLPGMKIDAVVSDGYGGAYSAVEALITSGYKRIVHIHSPLSTYSFLERFNGYLDAMQKYHLMPKFYEFDDISENMSYVIDLMLNTFGKPDAIFTSNDFAASKAIIELQKRGFNAPLDPYIIGFDDSPEAEKLGFSSVRVYKSELGSFAMRRVVTLIMKQDVHPAKISLFTELIFRSPLKNFEKGV